MIAQDPDFTGDSATERNTGLYSRRERDAL